MQHFFRLATLVVVSIGFAVPQFAQSLTITGENVHGTAIDLPAASKGKPIIIAVASSKKAEPMLQEWYEPAYLRFVSKQGLFAGSVDVDLWMVPVFTGLNKAAFGPTIERLKKGVDPEVAERVVFVKEDAAGLLDRLGIKDRELPYIFAIDAKGRIVHQVKGAFSVEKLDALEEAVSQ